MDHSQVIIRPVVSEKSYVLSAANRYTFRVHDEAHKTQIRQAIEALFDVHVVEVRTSSVKSKPKRRGTTSGRTRKWKKAIVQVREGESIPVRLSHVVINSADPEATRAFYETHLGFALSDTLMHPHMGQMMWFMRINSWHHSLAIARCPHPSLHHASFELRGLDEYMRGTGRLLRAGVEKIWGPGRHLAGNNTFSYFLDPHGNTVEYTTELEQVDEDTWHPHLYDFTQPDVADQWGTANAMNEFIAAKSFNDPDRGMFTAPPV